jgi:thiol:disulfide interchange protein DsbA
MVGGLWNVHGQMFLTLQVMAVENRVRSAVFDAVHKEGKNLATPQEQAEFLSAQGVGKDQYLAAFNSFQVKGAVEKAKQLAKDAQITSTPSMAVNGRYRTDAGSAGGPEAVLNVVDQLVARG